MRNSPGLDRLHRQIERSVFKALDRTLRVDPKRLHKTLSRIRVHQVVLTEALIYCIFSEIKVAGKYRNVKANQLVKCPEALRDCVSEVMTLVTEVLKEADPANDYTIALYRRPVNQTPDDKKPG